VIGVSKFCCPVCWELIQALRKKKQIEIRGCHSSLYLVELPPGLPSEVTHHLLQRFKDFAKVEVTKVMQPIPPSSTRHQRHPPSGESVVAIFSGSKSSESEEEADEDSVYGSPLVIHTSAMRIISGRSR
jgi:hypothetical protein